MDIPEKQPEQAKTRDERIAEMLDKSGADAVNSIKGPSLADFAQPEPEVKQEEVPDVEDDESNDKKVRIPRSRLKTLTSKVSELEARLQESMTYQERVAALEAQIKSNREEEDLPQWWIDAYGDTDISKQGYKNQQRIMREEMQRALQEQEARRQAEEAERVERINAIEQSFDEQMDELEDTIGRELTASQKSELLDIVGEYSPQEDGQYLAYMPVSKAYELWQRGQGTNAGKQEMARIAGTQSSGGSGQASSPERPQWGDWRKRFGA